MQVILSKYDDSVVYHFFRFVKRFLCACCSDESGYKWSFERAPEPTDVFWENLSIPALRRMKNIILTYLATLFVIGCCFGVIYGLNYS
jgi:hypothetical protein